MKKKEKLKNAIKDVTSTDKKYRVLEESNLIQITTIFNSRTKTYSFGTHTDDLSYGPKDNIRTEIRDGDTETGFPPGTETF